MAEATNRYQWYAVYTRSRGEKTAERLLKEQGIECYLPLKRELRQWSDRKKWVEVPYIASYLFVKVSQQEYHKVLASPMVSRYVFFSGKAASIPDWQIELMRSTIASDMEVAFSLDHYKKGDKIRIESAPLKGVEGEILSTEKGKKQQLLVRIGDIGMNLIISLNDMKISKL